MAKPKESAKVALSRGKHALSDFRLFLLRGNVVDLAIGVAIGAAFGAVVNSFTKGLITPLIALVGGQPDFGSMKLVIRGTTFAYGDFLNALVTFVIAAAVLFFFVVRPVNRLMERFTSDESPSRKCPECLCDIPKAARRCSHCSSKVKPEAA